MKKVPIHCPKGVLLQKLDDALDRTRNSTYIDTIETKWNIKQNLNPADLYLSSQIISADQSTSVLFCFV